MAVKVGSSPLSRSSSAVSRFSFATCGRDDKSLREVQYLLCSPAGSSPQELRRQYIALRDLSKDRAHVGLAVPSCCRFFELANGSGICGSARHNNVNGEISSTDAGHYQNEERLLRRAVDAVI